MKDFLNKEIEELRNEIFANNKTIADLQLKNKKKQQKLSMMHELRAKYFREINIIEIPNIQDKKIDEYISRIRRLKVDYFTLYKDLNITVSRTAEKYQLCQNNEFKFECRDIEEFIHYVEDYLKKQENAKSSIELTKEPFSQEFYDRQNTIFKYEPTKTIKERIAHLTVNNPLDYSEHEKAVKQFEDDKTEYVTNHLTQEQRDRLFDKNVTNEILEEDLKQPIKIHHEAIEKIHDAQKQAIENIESKIIDFVRTKYIKRHQYYSIKYIKLVEWLNNNSLTMYDFKKAIEKVFTWKYQSNANGTFYIIREK